MSIIVAIADAIVDELSSNAFSTSFTVRRAYLPEYHLSRQQGLLVTGGPREAEITNGERSRQQRDYSVEIGVQAKVDANDLEAIDGLMTFVEEIGNHLHNKRRLEGSCCAVCLTVQQTYLYMPGELEQQGVFTSVLTAIYRALE